MPTSWKMYVIGFLNKDARSDPDNDSYSLSVVVCSLDGFFEDVSNKMHPKGTVIYL